MNMGCPGAKNLKEPQPQDMKCPFCNYVLEVWTDEVKVKCPNCQKTIIREQASSCLDWCKYAKECVGDAAYRNYIHNKHISLKEILIKELEAYFGDDTRRINHAKKVMHYANELLKEEPGDWHIVIPASILHDVGIKLAEEKYGSSAGRYQEKEGPEIARKILLKTGFQNQDVGQICQIIAHHHSPGKITTQNFKLLYDADQLVNLGEETGIKDKLKLKEIISRVFLTDTAKKIASSILFTVVEKSQKKGE
jgi:HD superfamily phosphohydrolase YqeK/predicted RNA-binding Zn-ribbon protein involved in translation (DUF1610 family)